MMTIKHVSPMGNEMLLGTEEVSYCPHAEQPPPTRPGFGSSVGSLWWKSPTTDQLVEIRDGMCYVMNDHGSTVGKYDLGGWANGPS